MCTLPAVIGTVYTILNSQIFLFYYRLTSPTPTGVAPAEFMVKQRPHSQMAMDLIFPSLKDKVSQQQQRQKLQNDRTTRQCTFQQDDLVMIHNFN